MLYRDKYLDSKQESRESSVLQPTQVISEFQVMKEVLWMLQVSTDTCLFMLDDKGQFIVKPMLSLSSTIPVSVDKSPILKEPCLNLLNLF